MNTLAGSKNALAELKNCVDHNIGSIYSHTFLEKNRCDENTISIVMTSSNRSKQVTCTLKRIAESAYKNVHVVLVDDSTVDPCVIDTLESFPFSIDFIQINREKKMWHNPCVNYNIGFKFIRGGRVVIQNSEVCHVGDVLQWVSVNTIDDVYHVFDVRASKNYESNDILYVSDLTTTNIYNQNGLFDIWYQSASFNRQYHFLAATTISTFKKFNGFSYDYSFGSAWDDDDLILRIRAGKIRIQSMHHEVIECGGIHLFHVLAGQAWDTNREANKSIFEAKRDYLAKHGAYLELSDDFDTFERNYAALKNRA
jgi:hypothetical protein